MGNASGMVARIAKCLKKLLIHCHVSPWSAKAEKQWWDAYCFGSQDFLPAALASLLFSKILLLPSPGNETCRSSETCDYDFFSLNHAVYLSLNVLFLCFLIFMVAAMHWVSVPTASHPAAGACLSARCSLWDLPESRLCLSLGGFFAYTSWKWKS